MDDKICQTCTEKADWYHICDSPRGCECQDLNCWHQEPRQPLRAFWVWTALLAIWTVSLAWATVNGAYFVFWPCR